MPPGLCQGRKNMMELNISNIRYSLRNFPIALEQFNELVSDYKKRIEVHQQLLEIVNEHLGAFENRPRYPAEPEGEVVTPSDMAHPPVISSTVPAGEGEVQACSIYHKAIDALESQCPGCGYTPSKYSRNIGGTD